VCYRAFIFLNMKIKVKNKQYEFKFIYNHVPEFLKFRNPENPVGLDLDKYVYLGAFTAVSSSGFYHYYGVIGTQKAIKVSFHYKKRTIGQIEFLSPEDSKNVFFAVLGINNDGGPDFVHPNKVLSKNLIHYETRFSVESYCEQFATLNAL
jgi:hypothetical protein